MKKIKYIIRNIVYYILYILSLNKEFRAFHNFSFDTNAPMPENASEILEKCCRVLEQHNFIYRLTDGTILGLYRQGSFIPHDNDIDIDMLDCKDMDLLQESMKRIGMKLGRKSIYKKQVHQLIFYSKEHVIFDIVFWYSKGDQVFNYAEEGYERVQPKKYFMNLENIQYREKSYPMPSHIEEWLIFRYGKDWRIPKTFKGDWKNECYDLKKIGSV